MGIVIFGHGGLDPIAAKDMEWVALPAGTTLQFYADAGQTLRTGPWTWQVYANSLDAPWPALDSTRVSYNLALDPLSPNEQKEIAGLTDFPHTIFMVGRDAPSAQLCDGDSTTCPSDPRMITGEVEGPKTHGCTGLLNRFAGQELHWVACTAIEGFGQDAMDAVTTARGDAPEEVFHGAAPDTYLGQGEFILREHSAARLERWWDELPEHERATALDEPEFKTFYDEHLATQ